MVFLFIQDFQKLQPEQAVEYQRLYANVQHLR